MPDPALTVEHVAVRDGRLVLRVRVSANVSRETNPALAQRLMQLRPSLAHHACVNDKGSTFAAVASRTSLPHVLEHLIIDNQVRAHAARASAACAASPSAPSVPLHTTSAQPSRPARHASADRPAPAERAAAYPPSAPATFVGTTEWLNEAAGIARVEVNFTDDLIALRALHDALALLNGEVVPLSHDSTHNIRPNG